MSRVNVTQVVAEVMVPFVDTTTAPTAFTERFDAGTGSQWMITPQISDSGNELRGKTIKAIRVTGRLTNASAMVYAFDVGQAINVTDIENGVRTNTKSITRPQIFPDTTEVTQSARKPVNVVGVLHTARVEGDDTGKTVRDRIDEIVYEQSIQGVRR